MSEWGGGVGREEEHTTYLRLWQFPAIFLREMSVRVSQLLTDRLCSSEQPSLSAWIPLSVTFWMWRGEREREEGEGGREGMEERGRERRKEGREGVREGVVERKGAGVEKEIMIWDRRRRMRRTLQPLMSSVSS